MKFLSPAFLFALIALAVPIIIHLFSFRRFKKVYFPDITFLREIKQERRATSRLRHLLVLASRLLFLTFLILAFAQPYIPGSQEEKAGTGQVVSIYLDNSFSMNATGPAGRLFDLARAKAREIALAYDQSARFQLLTNDFESRHQELVSRESFLDYLDLAEESPAFRTMPEIITRQYDLLINQAAGAAKDIYLISDFQQNMVALDDLPHDTTLSLNLVPLPVNPVSNLYLDSVWFPSPVRSPAGTETVIARLVNAGNREMNNVPVQLFINDAQRTQAVVSLPAGGSTDLELSYSQSGPGVKAGRITVQDHPILYDDDFFFSYSVNPSIPVLIINGSEPNSWLQSFFRTEPYFKADQVETGAVDYASLGQYNVVILNEPSVTSSGMTASLLEFVENGGHLVVFPPAEGDIAEVNALLAPLNAGVLGPQDTSFTRIADLEEEHEIFSGVFEEMPENTDMPVAHKFYPLQSPAGARLIPVMDMGAKGLFLGAADRGAGRVYTFATPPLPEFTNFQQHAFFVPVMYKIIISSQRSDVIYHYTGQDVMVPFKGSLTGGDKLVRIADPAGTFEMAPEIIPAGGKVYLGLHDMIRESGNYQVMYNNELVQGLALNYPRLESSPDIFTAEELGRMAESEGVELTVIDKPSENLTRKITETNLGTPLWKYCIWLALIFLALEIILLRLAGRSFTPSKELT